jgi:hypothetical protein
MIVEKNMGAKLHVLNTKKGVAFTLLFEIRKK